MRTLFATCFALSLACTAASAQDRVRPAPRPRTEVNAPDPFARLRVNGRVMVGDQAPDFALTSSTGNDVALSSMRGDWLLLRFAADRKELAELAPM